MTLLGAPSGTRTARDCPVGLCDGSGFVVDEATNTAYDCQCRAHRIAQARARSLSALIPPRYARLSFDRPPVTEIEPQGTVIKARRFARDISRHLDAGRGLWFMGPVGTGKTTLAMLVSRAALDAGRSVAIYSLPRLLNEIRETAHQTDRSHVDLLDRLVDVDLLHLDDVGAERMTDWVLEELYSIVNARYEHERSMLITTNLAYDELSAQISARTASRLAHMCDDLPVEGEDRRLDFTPRDPI